MVQHDPELALTLEAELNKRYGFLIAGRDLRIALGYASDAAFRQAALRHTVPIPIFTLPRRRGRFALVKDLAAWLAAQRNGAAQQMSQPISAESNKPEELPMP